MTFLEGAQSIAPASSLQGLALDQTAGQVCGWTVASCSATLLYDQAVSYNRKRTRCSALGFFGAEHHKTYAFPRRVVTGGGFEFKPKEGGVDVRKGRTRSGTFMNLGEREILCDSNVMQPWLTMPLFRLYFKKPKIQEKDRLHRNIRFC